MHIHVNRKLQNWHGNNWAQDNVNIRDITVTRDNKQYRAEMEQYEERLKCVWLGRLWELLGQTDIGMSICTCSPVEGIMVWSEGDEFYRDFIIQTMEHIIQDYNRKISSDFRLIQYEEITGGNNG
jgi:hypothetical protein